jgi:hypothetical protein
MTKLISFLVYLSVATFILFTGSAFVAGIGFAFHGTLIQAIMWSVITSVGLLVGYAILGGIVSAMFGLESFGRVGEVVVGTVVGGGVLFGMGMFLPALMLFPTVASALCAGSIGALIVTLLGGITGRLTFRGQMLPRRKANTNNQ